MEYYSGNGLRSLIFFQATQEFRFFFMRHLPILAWLLKKHSSSKTKVLPVRFRPQGPICQVWACRLAVQQGLTCLVLIQEEIRYWEYRGSGQGKPRCKPGTQAAKVPGPSDLPAEYPSDRAAESRSLVGGKNVPYRRHEEYFNLKHWMFSHIWWKMNLGATSLNFSLVTLDFYEQ